MNIQEKIEKIFTNGEICTCVCHRNKGTMHIIPCCNLTYEQYINTDGIIDYERLEEAMNKYLKLYK